MAHRWRYETAEGTPANGPEAEFVDAAEAEAWLGDHWEELAEQGVAQVSLLDGEDLVYGPMGLGPA